MAHGGKVHLNPSHAPAHYIPEDLPPRMCLADMVFLWLSGCACGIVLTLIAVGQ
jgi:hypothetical protein